MCSVPLLHVYGPRPAVSWPTRPDRRAALIYLFDTAEHNASTPIASKAIMYGLASRSRQTSSTMLCAILRISAALSTHRSGMRQPETSSLSEIAGKPLEINMRSTPVRSELAPLRCLRRGCAVDFPKAHGRYVPQYVSRALHSSQHGPDHERRWDSAMPDAAGRRYLRADFLKCGWFVIS